ncbi:hypothetical protein TcasGA2_TC034724 [Tribolium castaneum]|uniref:Uncharacterized protein n=1 Tax=Tribolium castaneum TaxID=7070 RepID=A0A139WGT2_TRICA|nr:hypothetical protein TcasGA2_TC034724 [Tribolium castaneum]
MSFLNNPVHFSHTLNKKLSIVCVIICKIMRKYKVKFVFFGSKIA